MSVEYADTHESEEEFLNLYCCLKVEGGCGRKWSEVYSAMCDSTCPTCGRRNLSPHRSMEISELNVASPVDPSDEKPDLADAIARVQTDRNLAWNAGARDAVFPDMSYFRVILGVLGPGECHEAEFVRYAFENGAGTWMAYDVLDVILGAARTKLPC